MSKFEYGGWAGKVLRVNLTTGAITTVDTSKYHDFIGGMGIGYKVIWDEVPDGISALDPKNKLIISAGPITGSGAICTGRTTITSLSPCIPGNLVADGHFGGHFSPELKNAGYDAIIIEGKSAKPVWLCINDDKVSLEDAKDLWGKGIFDTHADVAKIMGPQAQVAAIGQSGENQVHYSVIMTQGGHSAGSHGAVLGSKNFKAVGVIGTKGVKIVANKEQMEELDKYILSIIGSNNNNVVPMVPQPWSEFSNKQSRWKAREGLVWGAADEPVNIGMVRPEETNRIAYRCSMSESYVGPKHNEWTKRMGGCHSCPIRCFCELKVPELKTKYKMKNDHISNVCMGFYTPQWLLTGGFVPASKMTENQSMAAALGAYLCDDYGTWCNYGLIGYIFNYCHKYGVWKRVLPAEEYASIPWDKFEAQDPAFLVDFYERVVNKKGQVSRVAMAPHTFIAEWKLDQDSTEDKDKDGHLRPGIYKDHHVHIFNKKMNATVHHSNEANGQVGSLISTVFNRDAQCHSHQNYLTSGLPTDILQGIAEELWGKGAIDKPNSYTPINQAKVNFTKWSLVRNVLHDSLTLCNWMFPLALTHDKSRGYKGDTSIESKMFSLVTGKKVTEEELDFMAERTLQLHRALTVRQMGTKDMRNEHDVPADWVYDKDPAIPAFSDGTNKMDRDDMQKGLTMFYKTMGWDEKLGFPTRATLEKFGLKDVADELAAKNLI